MTRMILRAFNTPLLILLVILAVSLQSSLFSSWPFSYFQPDAVLLVVVWCALRRNFLEGGILTLIFANLGEIHSAAPQGVFLITYMIIYLSVRGSSRFLVIPTLMHYTLLTMASSMALRLLNLFVLYLLTGSASGWKHVFTFLPLGAAIEGFFSIWIFNWLEKFDWITFKHFKADRVMDEDLNLEYEGF
jgi:hypothetical protein